ncbi:mRNA turnover protein 4-like protein [Smittium mucronatum]|uniref:Ribosome assembly factor mrt4 n=1 Tax=Smittium mucronatum TaxID=133383 RepID=A0A1R0H000_9FUNG|nr:mRNA turnover protein 4-like protein [Smittium mucronatum]OLY82408.1 mRNA turnover protein 4-like protein [Smittium mucronatum]
MRNSYLKEVRSKLNNSRFFFGRNKVMSKALGSDQADEYKENLHLVSKLLTGEVGLLFSNDEPSYTIDFFKNYSESDYAKAGFVSTVSITVPAGELFRGDSFVSSVLNDDVDMGAEDEKDSLYGAEHFPPNMEPQLRSLGLPTQLVKGKIHCAYDYNLVSKGQILNPKQAQLLKLFGVKLATFKVKLLCSWKNDGSFTTLK